MKITFKSIGGRHIVTVDGMRKEFNILAEAWDFIRRNRNGK